MVRSRVRATRKITGWILAIGLVTIPRPMPATTPLPTAEPLPPSDPSSVPALIIPEPTPPVPFAPEPVPPTPLSSGPQPQPSLQPQTSFDLLAPTYPPPPNLDFELPRSDPLKMPPLRVDESLLRLEIRLSQRRVVVFQGKVPLKSYAIAVGRPGWETPTGVFNVRQMFKNPTWVHPLKPGILIPGGDPENPLGLYWIGFWTDGKNWIGFHGTDNPGSVGKAVSHGCIRMYNKDIEELFKKVSLGTEVKVVR